MFYYQFAENAIRRLLSACRRLEGYMTGQIEDEENKDDSSSHMSLQKFSAVKYG